MARSANAMLALPYCVGGGWRFAYPPYLLGLAVTPASAAAMLALPRCVGGGWRFAYPPYLLMRTDGARPPIQ